jgi:hypothetical protein
MTQNTAGARVSYASGFLVNTNVSIGREARYQSQERMFKLKTHRLVFTTCYLIKTTVPCFLIMDPSIALPATIQT